jgi:hypothetical protein
MKILCFPRRAERMEELSGNGELSGDEFDGGYIGYDSQ